MENKKLRNPQMRPVIANAPLRKAVAQLKAGKHPHIGIQEQLRGMLNKQGGSYFALLSWNLEKQRAEDTNPLLLAHSTQCELVSLKRRATKKEIIAAYQSGKLPKALVLEELSEVKNETNDKGIIES